MKHEIPVFDGDGHVLERDDQLQKYYEGEWSNMKRMDGMPIFPSLDGWARASIMDQADDGPRSWSTDARIWGDILDRIGLEGSVLYPTGGLAFGLMQSHDFQTATAIAYNNWLEGEYTTQDDRLYGAGLVPINDMDAARKEIVRCATKRKNFPAILLPTVTVNGKSFGDEYYWPIYEEAERHNMPLAFHGAPSRGFGLDNLKPFLKVHTLEHPVPLMIQMTDMMFSGVFEAFPKLKVAFLEGGCSWITFMMDRLDYEYDSVFGVGVRKKLKKKPSEIIRDTDSIWLSCEMGESSLKYVIDAMGSDRIIYASDFPHEPTDDDLTADVPEFLADETYSMEVKEKILYHNTKRFYNID